MPKSAARSASPESGITDRYVGIPEAAEYLDVEHKFIRRKIASGELPAYRLGGRLVKIKLSDLDALLVPIPHAKAD